mmetsp:Transcript_6029/g.13208  ORF Transcript_6029/g.13208 Transcript_6029/m.13208 type:complete len:88 (+) Transcript_6029:723-986(+)
MSSTNTKYTIPTPVVGDHDVSRNPGKAAEGGGIINLWIRRHVVLPGGLCSKENGKSTSKAREKRATALVGNTMSGNTMDWVEDGGGG